MGGRRTPILPWTSGHGGIFDEFPGNPVAAPDAKKVTNSRADINTGVAVGVGFRCVAFENILPVLRVEGAAVFPLGVTNFATVMDGNPSTFADRAPRPFVRFPEPGNNPGCFRVMISPRNDIVKGQGYVKGVESRGEIRRVNQARKRWAY